MQRPGIISSPLFFIYCERDQVLADEDPRRWQEGDKVSDWDWQRRRQRERPRWCHQGELRRLGLQGERDGDNGDNDVHVKDGEVEYEEEDDVRSLGDRDYQYGYGGGQVDNNYHFSIN